MARKATAHASKKERTRLPKKSRPDLKRGKTQRGFAYYKFTDRYGAKCSIQKSSLAFEDAIWFGADDIGLQRFIAGKGWEPVKLKHTIEEHYVANNRMHLTRELVEELLPILKKFVKTGRI